MKIDLNAIAMTIGSRIANLFSGKKYKISQQETLQALIGVAENSSTILYGSLSALAEKEFPVDSIEYLSFIGERITKAPQPLAVLVSLHIDLLNRLADALASGDEVDVRSLLGSITKQ